MKLSNRTLGFGVIIVCFFFLYLAFTLTRLPESQLPGLELYVRKIVRQETQENRSEKNQIKEIHKNLVEMKSEIARNFFFNREVNIQKTLDRINVTNITLGAPIPLRYICLRWVQTPACVSNFDLPETLPCRAVINYSSGYCECQNVEDGNIVQIPLGETCDHPPMSCLSLCSGEKWKKRIGNESGLLKEGVMYPPKVTRLPSLEFSSLRTPYCASKWGSQPELSPKLKKSLTSKRYYFATNVHDNAYVFPHMIYEILRTVIFLGTSNCFVSIYESGSSDLTPWYIIQTLHIFQSWGIAAKVLSEPELRPGKDTYRIAWLASARNRVLEPFYLSPTGTWDRIIFLNDVFFCMEDIIKLLLYEADLSCSLDYRYPFGYPSWVLYDNWVLRSRDGERLEGLEQPYWSDEFSKKLFYKNWPIPVMSCWNGMAIMNSKPFYEGVRFRHGVESDGDCLSSECFLLALDFIANNFTKILIDPQVRVAYEWSVACALLQYKAMNFTSPPSWNLVTASDLIYYPPLGKHYFCEDLRPNATERGEMARWMPV